MYLVIIEPRLALYRYLESARKKLKTLVVTANESRCRAGEAHYRKDIGLPEGSEIDELVVCDTTNAESIYAALAPYHGQIAGVVPADEPAVSIAADLGRRLGFDYAAPEDAVCHHIKTNMKQRFKERGVRTPDYVVAHTYEEAKNAWERFGRRSILKMVNYASSINVYQITSIEELDKAWDIIVHNRRNVHSNLPLRDEVLIEEIVTGRELSAEGYIQDGKVTVLSSCEKITETNFQIVGHYVPSALSQAEYEALVDVTTQCVQSLGIKNSPFHMEAHLRDGVPYVIECAARPPGHHVTQLLKNVYGFDLMEIAIALASGERCTAAPSAPSKHYAIFVLYSKEAGVLKEISGLDELRRRGGLAHLEVSIKPGDRVEPLVSPDQRYGIVLLEDETAEGVREKARWMRENVSLVLESA